MSNGFIACTLKCISSFTQYWWPVQGEGGEHDRLHIDGTRVISLVPDHSWNLHLLQKKLKNKYGEREGNTTKLESRGCDLTRVLGQVRPAHRVSANTHPSSWNSAPEPTSSEPPEPAVPEGLLPQVTRGRRIKTDRPCDSSSRGEALQWSPCQQLQVPSSSASDYLAVPGMAWHVGLEARLGQMLSGTGRPSSSHPGMPRTS